MMDLKFGRSAQLGESTESDLRLIRAAVKLVNDKFFEALIVGGFTEPASLGTQTVDHQTTSHKETNIAFK